MTDLHDQIYPYIVGALPVPESAQFERHLTDCEDCRADVVALRQVAAELSNRVAAEPPPRLRSAVLAAIEDLPQQPGYASGGRRLRLLSGQQQSPAVAPTAGTAGQRPSSSWSWLPALVAAAAVLAALGFGGWAWQDRQSAQQEALQASQRTSQLTDLLSAEDVKVVTGQVTVSKGSGTVVLSPSRNEAVLVASGLPELPSGHVYQAWTIGRRPVPAGTFSLDGARSLVELPAAALRSQSVAITVEPTGGSDKPTTGPIFTVSIPRSI